MFSRSDILSLSETTSTITNRSAPRIKSSHASSWAMLISGCIRASLRQQLSKNSQLTSRIVTQATTSLKLRTSRGRSSCRRRATSTWKNGLMPYLPKSNLWRQTVLSIETKWTLEVKSMRWLWLTRRKSGTWQSSTLSSLHQKYSLSCLTSSMMHLSESCYQILHASCSSLNVKNTISMRYKKQVR